MNTHRTTSSTAAWRPTALRNRMLRALAVVALITAWAGAASAEDSSPTSTTSEIAALRAAVDALRADYQRQIHALEARLAAAESALEAAETGSDSVPPLPSNPPPRTRPALADNATNPAIGVVFQGQAWHSNLGEEHRGIPGYPLGGEAGPPPRGLASGETEVGISANVDDLFTARATIPIAIEDGETHVELEEAWLETLRLPAGLSTRFGRFYSGIGYLNGKHAHAWDFADQPLVYQAFLGNQYFDDGIQVRWLPPTEQYLEFGTELFRGDNYPAGGAADNGAGTWALFARTGGDIGVSQSWQSGISYLRAQSDGRESGPEDEPIAFTGDTELMVAEWIWKWAPNGNWSNQNLKIQAEYLWRKESGAYALDPEGDPARLDRDQAGWYLQTVYQPRAQWRVGARYDRLSNGDPGAAFAGTLLEPADDPDRFTIMVDWSHSEFSRLRLQYARDRSTERAGNDWALQYILSIGAHGAHAF